MPTKTIDIHELQPGLAELLPLVTAGAEIILTEKNMPVARLMPLAGLTTTRISGLHPGGVWMSEDFDAPLPDEFWVEAP